MADRDRYDEMAEQLWPPILMNLDGRALLATALRAAAEEARREEREACAQAAEARVSGMVWDRKGEQAEDWACRRQKTIAARIRARGGSGG